ncbi:zinc-dependent metalloprotease [Spartinivicinus poritis]|uniref:Zinc-dependent metalloprotease n=1 Tax=Spartinivicinus poritis TaxID=2994640 RepID=A0ABT5U777_9GAMM|nr:zinc-dependent metalloprotease [Spartinivicinus sp. A2-2]MDE1462231.1 zinc-dependent metalloprotease [Spartinivicinus sp. A2-2]
MPNKLFLSTLATLQAGLLTFASHAVASQTEIDVLVLYTPGAASLYGGNPTARIDHLMAVTNQVYQDSGLNLKLRAVHTHQVNYSDTGNAGTALRALTNKSDPAFSQVDQLREKYGADMVMLYRPYHTSHASCGVAWVGGYKSNGNLSNSYYKNYMYSHVAISTCGEYVTSHELGHNMGLLHSRKQDGSGGTYPYALGHGEQGKFVTIMAYQSAYNVNYWKGKVYKFSSPNIQCQDSPCGVDRHDTYWGADAAYALGVTTPQIAKYFPTKVKNNNPLLEELKKAKAKLDEINQQITENKTKLRSLRQQLRQARYALWQRWREFRQAWWSRQNIWGAWRTLIDAYKQRYTIRKEYYASVQKLRGLYKEKRVAWQHYQKIKQQMQ